MSKNNRAWTQIIDKYNIIHEVNMRGSFIIEAKQIKELREPRLMTKFDHRSSLPQVFKDNELSILPVTRGSYIIGRFKNYKNIDALHSKQITYVSIPSHIESIDFNNIYSESTALNCAYVSGIIDDFICEESYPTVSGRMSSSTFDFTIESGNKKDLMINVKNSQVEIDGGFESLNKLALIEAKNHLADDFLIRQMYYPYRLWLSKISKPITNIYMAYSNDTFHFYEYDFEDPGNYNSLILTRYKAYRISPEEISIQEIIDILSSSKIKVNETGAPFPQADNFNRIVDLFGLLKANSSLTKEEITNNYGFDERQADYYINALIFMGIAIRSVKGSYSLSKKGNSISLLNHKQKTLSIISGILENEVFYKVLKGYLDSFQPVEKKVVIKIMSESQSLKEKSGSTITRRAQTVLKWVERILEQIE